MTLIAVTLIACHAAATTTQATPVDINRPVPALRTAAAFRHALKQPVTADLRAVPLRGVLNDLSKAGKIAILLDRRIDPTRKVTIQLKKEELQIALQKIAATVSARVTLVGNVVYIGPAEAVIALEAILKKRMSETATITRRLSRTRRSVLTRTRTVHWNDLDAPRDLIADIAKDCRLTVTGLDNIPHDLWAGCTLPNATCTEALTLILAQFNLTFSWKPDGSGIAIVLLEKPDAKMQQGPQRNGLSHNVRHEVHQETEALAEKTGRADRGTRRFSV